LELRLHIYDEEDDKRRNIAGSYYDINAAIGAYIDFLLCRE